MVNEKQVIEHLKRAVSEPRQRAPFRAPSIIGSFRNNEDMKKWIQRHYPTGDYHVIIEKYSKYFNYDRASGNITLKATAVLKPRIFDRWTHSGLTIPELQEVAKIVTVLIELIHMTKESGNDGIELMSMVLEKAFKNSMKNDKQTVVNTMKRTLDECNAFFDMPATKIDEKWRIKLKAGVYEEAIEMFTDLAQNIVACVIKRFLNLSLVWKSLEEVVIDLNIILDRFAFFAFNKQRFELNDVLNIIDDDYDFVTGEEKSMVALSKRFRESVGRELNYLKGSTLIKIYGKVVLVTESFVFIEGFLDEKIGVLFKWRVDGCTHSLRRNDDVQFDANFETEFNEWDITNVYDHEYKVTYKETNEAIHEASSNPQFIFDAD